MHDRLGAGADNLIGSWTSGTRAGTTLEAFTGRSASGTWKLLCVDAAGQDMGKLNRWRLAVTT